MRVEADIDLPQVLHGAQKQPGADEQHQRDADLKHQQHLVSSVREPTTLRLVSLSAALTLMPVARSAGAMPNTTAVSTVTPSANATTRQSSGVACPVAPGSSRFPQ